VEEGLKLDVELGIVPQNVALLVEVFPRRGPSREKGNPLLDLPVRHNGGLLESAIFFTVRIEEIA
jgi:hypothetical protein